MGFVEPCDPGRFLKWVWHRGIAEQPIRDGQLFDRDIANTKPDDEGRTLSSSVINPIGDVAQLLDR